MKPMIKRVSAAATYSLALVVLAGCLGDDNTDFTSAQLDAPTITTASQTQIAAAPPARPATSGTSTPGSTGAAGTKSVLINWTPPTEYEDGSPFIDLAGYRIWYGRTPGSYSSLVDIAPGTTSFKVHSLAGATTYYFSITAYNHDGAESTLSNELMLKLN
jgi:hypothetical protein